VDWKQHPEHVYDLAARGLPALRETGYLDDQDRLILAGVPVPAPGTMASHVTSQGIDLLPDPDDDEPIDDVDDEPAEDWDDSAAESPEVPDPRAENDQEKKARFIVGLHAGADFCEMSVANFRKVRSLHPIDGEVSNYQGNKPGWEEPNLKLWAMRHADNRGRRSDDSEKGSA
jgi:hypothetical protein